MATNAAQIESEFAHIAELATWCPKCGGAGRLTWTSLDNGRCFTCGGSGRVKPCVRRAAIKAMDEAKALAALRTAYRGTRSGDYDESNDATSTVAMVGLLEGLSAESITKSLNAFAALGKRGSHTAGYAAWCACTMPRWYNFTAAQQRALLPFLAHWGRTEADRVPHRASRSGQYVPCPAGTWHFTGEAP